MGSTWGSHARAQQQGRVHESGVHGSGVLRHSGLHTTGSPHQSGAQRPQPQAQPPPRPQPRPPHPAAPPARQHPGSARFRAQPGPAPQQPLTPQARLGSQRFPAPGASTPAAALPRPAPRARTNPAFPAPTLRNSLEASAAAYRGGPVDPDPIPTTSTEADTEGDSQGDTVPGEPSPRALGTSRLKPDGGIALRAGLTLRIDHVLGEGGMGIVYLVRDDRLGRLAALKLIRGKQSGRRVRRFVRETSVTARLNHPGIPPVYEAGVTPEGMNFLLMRYVAGESLHKRLKRLRAGSLGPSQAEKRDLLEALVRAGEAVAYAHSQRIVHRDLKPDNIMIGAYGEVFVMDWGLARDLSESAQVDHSLRHGISSDGESPEDSGQQAMFELTRTGATLGTVGYMAPEQARGEEIDTRADQFALGAILAEILTGASPLGGFALEKLENVVEGKVKRLRDLDPRVAPELDAITAKAMHPQREGRYASAEALVEDLKAYLEGRAVSAYHYRLSERVLRLLRRHRAAAISLCVTFFAALVVVGVLASSRAREAAKLEQHLSAGEAALAAGDPAKAREQFVTALNLDPMAVRGQVGKLKAEQGLEELEQRETEEAEREQAEQFVEVAATRMADGDLEGAREAYTKAQAYRNAPPEALEGLARVERLLARYAAAEQQRLERQRDSLQAEEFEERGRAHLQAGDWRAAEEAFLKSLAFGSGTAQEPLEEAREALLRERLEQRQEELRERARVLAEEGARALTSDDLEAAQTAFTQALAFDGSNYEAQAGLAEIYQRIASQEDVEARKLAEAAAVRQAQLAQERKLNELRRNLDVAQRKLEDAQEAYLAGANTLDVLEAYFGCLEPIDVALFLDPESTEARGAKRLAGAQLADYLTEQGQVLFADFIRRTCGVEEGEETQAALPRDLYLVVKEADAVRVRQALGPATRFLAARAFDGLRRYVRENAPRRRVRIAIRSKVAPGIPPDVLVFGLRIQLEDKDAGTLMPPVNLDFDEEYRRLVTADKLGRIVGAFGDARSANGKYARRHVREVEETVKRLLRQGR